FTELYEEPFYDCEKLRTITVSPENPKYAVLDGMLMSKDGKTLLVYPAGRRDTSFDVPISVTALGVRALANGYLVEVTLSPGITELPNSLFSGCGRLERVQLPVDLKKIGDNVFDYCDKLTEITIPAGVTGIGHGSFGDCESLTKITFLGNAPSFNISAFYGAALDVYYPGQNATWTEDVLQDYSGDINWIPYYDDRRVDLDSDAFGDTVWIDGEPHSIVRDKSGCYVKLPDTETELLVTYTFHMESKDPHTQYPTGMRVFRITDDGTGKKAEEIVEFADLLQYSGSSIRITGNKGIRMITSIEKSKKDALTGQGLAGYTLVEYGTVLCWSSEITGGLTLDKSYARSNFAYKKGVADPVFAYSGSLVQYTNVLVGFTNDQCRDDIAMRSYIILEDADGDQVTIYGGTVHRSIGYIAYQNRAAFAPGSAAYDYVWEIIHHVYGDQYDAEYEG
ncbi:MAG: leucine-rich repeat domain-containing protein, partial [Clostridia bacterium]|nr:leucine-rich repeat domain-containing protein [Clostridia bacterium]